MIKKLFGASLALLLSCGLSDSYAQNREKLSINGDWKFSFGNASDVRENFMTGTRYFNYLTKTGYGDGPADINFDDRAWRSLSLPHDWAVEVPFSPSASHSHGYKQVGWAFPETSVGWYRKKITIPPSDYGKKISLLFDGVFRNSEVWINGFYLGQEQSGYLDFQYDITDYINYGGENVITVKADAGLEEGWFYEGAGIYRDVWLVKTDPLHVKKDGVFVTSIVNGGNADITARVSVENESLNPRTASLNIVLRDVSGTAVAVQKCPEKEIKGVSEHEFVVRFSAVNILQWSIEKPNLYTVEVSVMENGQKIDIQSVKTGFRTIEFTADKGFFLNKKHVKIVGANIHQDFAGVGCAVPKDLQIERVKMLKKYGFNGIRTSHNPVNPDLLDVCDSLGMLILEETRLEGINDYHKTQLKRMIFRDRNHPSIIAWSVGNEEWQIESNIYGERITRTIQAYGKTLDSTRMFTAAVSGGCGYGTSESIELMGFNYLAQCDIDKYREKHLSQPGWLTEETSGCGTRGIYIADSANCHIPQFDRAGGTSIERGYKFCLEREWMSGLFYWTGFDYRGEATPFSYPAISSQFGILDVCGFPKDAAFYILANNTEQPVIHLFPHWNFKGMEGKTIQVWAYTNCDAAELFLNKKSLGKKNLDKYGHLSWDVKYAPGEISIKGYKNGKLVATDSHKTSDVPKNIVLTSSKSGDIALVSVSVTDVKGVEVPDASNSIKFEVSGGEILGVGNGDPSSLENDREFENSCGVKILAQKELTLKSLNNWQSQVAAAKQSDWRGALVYDRNERWDFYHDTLLAVKCEADLGETVPENTYTLFSKSILAVQDIYVNGEKVAENIQRDALQSFTLDRKILKSGKNEIFFVGKKIRKAYQWDEPNTDPGVIGVKTPAKNYSRNLFSGRALVVVRTKPNGGETVLKATSDGLKEARIVIK
jgi:beta-galactosidase